MLKNIRKKLFRNFSIKKKITLWYTLLMTALVVLISVILIMMSNTIEDMTAKTKLEQAIENAQTKMEYDGSSISFYDPVDTSRGGLYLIFYDDKYQYLTGSWPSGFPDGVEAADTAFRTVEYDSQEYYVYDRYLQFDEGNIWARGIFEGGNTGLIVSNTIIIIIFTLPLIVILAAVGGWFIIKKSFGLVDELREQADSISSGRDLTKRVDIDDGTDEIHLLARTLNSMLERLEKSFLAEQRFMSDISHELRTPVSVILAECQHGLKEKKSANAPLETGERLNGDIATGISGSYDRSVQARLENNIKALETIERQGKRMKSMTEEMLALSRMELGHYKPEFDEIDLTELAMIVCEDEQEIFPETIRLRTDFEQVTAWVNQDMIIRLMINLLGNAQRYARNEIAVSLKMSGQDAVLEVSDDGEGIPEDEQKNIFRSFYRSDSSRNKKNNSGMGLGLAMCEQIALAHNGSISVRSRMGKGSTFTVKIPVQEKASNGR